MLGKVVGYSVVGRSEGAAKKFNVYDKTNMKESKSSMKNTTGWYTGGKLAGG